MEEVLASTARLSKAAELVNSVAPGRVRAVVDVVLQWLASGEEGRVFSESDEESIKRKFAVDEDGFRLLIDMITFVYRQAAYSTVGVEDLNTVLRKVGLDDERCSLFVSAWETYGKAFVASLKQRSIGAPRSLETIGASTRVALVNQDPAVKDGAPQRVHAPLATLQFGIRHTASDSVETMSAELNADALYKLFTQVSGDDVVLRLWACGVVGCILSDTNCL